MHQRPRILDIRQIGPRNGLDISGTWSACGDVLFARLDQNNSGDLSALDQKLRDVFAGHVESFHKVEQGPPSEDVA